MTTILNLFLEGWLIGFMIALPVGPIAMLCIRHALIRGTKCGLIAGIGAASADAVYAVLAGLGVTIICDILTSYQTECHLLGAFVLCYLGIATLRTPPRGKMEEKMIPMSYWRILLTTFILTLSNPLTLISFIGIYAALGFGLVDHSFSSFLVITGGIFVGSTTWWSILSISSSLIGKKINFQSTHLLNQISGAAFLAFGLIVAFLALNQISLF